MKLLTKALEKRFKQVGSQEAVGENAVVLAKFFTPDSNWTWYASEYDPRTKTFFGLVDGFEKEYGYFNLDELESVRGALGLPIERDLYFSEATFKEIGKS